VCHLIDEAKGHPEVATFHLVTAKGQKGTRFGLLGYLKRLAAFVPTLEFETKFDVSRAHVDGGSAVLVRVALFAAAEVAVTLAGLAALSTFYSQRRT
jgi:hypothetical protein